MRALRWIKKRLAHKLSHLHPTRILDLLKEHGMALVVIIVAWEIIEDILFPLLFIWLGNNINPWFLTGARLAGFYAFTP